MSIPAANFSYAGEDFCKFFRTYSEKLVQLELAHLILQARLEHLAMEQLKSSRLCSYMGCCCGRSEAILHKIKIAFYVCYNMICVRLIGMVVEP